MAQTSCPKCLAIIPMNSSQCPECGATEASLTEEAASARANKLPSLKPSVFRWKRESIVILKALAIGFPLYLLFRWFLFSWLG